MFVKLTKLTLKDGRPAGELHLLPESITTIEAGRFLRSFDSSDPGSTLITLKDKRTFLVHGSPEEVLAQLKAHKA